MRQARRRILDKVGDDMRSILPLRKMAGNVGAWSRDHQSNKPYPHIGIDDFFYPNLIADLVRAYPCASNSSWKRASFDPQHEEEKLSLNRIEDLQDVAVRMVKEGSLAVRVQQGPTSRKWGVRRRTERVRRLGACILTMHDPRAASTPI
jgi:hypothetical protein